MFRNAGMIDLLIKGGSVVDPGAGLAGQLDVAVEGDRIVAVEPAIPAESACRVIDAEREIVTPGLVDIHTHVYRGMTYWGIDADSLASRTGVTTWVDAGSAGAFTFLGFRESIVEPAQVRIRSWLNISAIGLVAPNYELAHLEHCDVDLCRLTGERNRDLVVGLKVRMGAPAVGENGMDPMRRARRAADLLGLPLMVHIGFGPPDIDEVIELMRAGDVLTHCFTGGSMRLIDEHGRARKSVEHACRTGVVMDVGHGTGSFSYAVAEELIAQGKKPDVISSDAHQLSVNGPMFDLPTCMSKFMGLGMSLEEVVEAATSRPAGLLHLDAVGSLRPGSYADIALFTLKPGPFRVFDAQLEERELPTVLRNTCTVVGGRVLPRRPPDRAAAWIPLTHAQQAWHAALRRGEAEPPPAYLAQPADFAWWDRGVGRYQQPRESLDRA